MNFSLFFLLLALFCVSNFAAIHNLSGEHTSLNFYSGTWLFKFYAPWCQHSEKLAPVWDEIGEFYERYFEVVKVDCTREPEFCEEQQVTAFPVIKLFHEGKEHIYNGRRNKEEIIAWVGETTGQDVNNAKHAKRILREQNEKAVRGTPFENLHTDNFKEKLTPPGDWIVLFEDINCPVCDEAAEVLTQVSQTEGLNPPNSKFRFGKIDCSIEKEACAAYGIYSGPYPKTRYIHNEFVFHFTEEWKVENVIKFLDLYYQTWSYPRLITEPAPEPEQAEAVPEAQVEVQEILQLGSGHDEL